MPVLAPILADDLAAIDAALDERDALKGATILVTGCAGFLGYMFMQYLARLEGVKLIALDSFLLGKPAWLTNLTAKRTNITLHSFDIAKGSIADIPGAGKADYVIHMASIASPPFYREYPLETLDANIWGLRKLLDFYVGKKLKGLLFFSSSEIYGDPVASAIPTPEDYRGNVACMGPRACYDEAKRFGETLCYTFFTKYKMPIGIARPFNNYGPGMRLGDKRAPADFAKAVMENRAIELFSDGTPTRTFCYITDAITGYLKVLINGHGEAFNIGMDKPEITIKRLADLFVDGARKELNYTGKGVVLSPPPTKEYLTDNPNRRCPVIDKARQHLNFRPSIGVEDGVARFLRFLKENEDAR